jgi:hypothetical protein
MTMENVFFAIIMALCEKHTTSISNPNYFGRYPNHVCNKHYGSYLHNISFHGFGSWVQVFGNSTMGSHLFQ